MMSRNTPRRFRYRLAAATAVLVATCLAVSGRWEKPSPPGIGDFDARIRYYSKKVAAYPEHYPAYALLGAAYLDKARETHDPELVKEARTALDRSLEIQANFNALSTMAALCNFSHRFAEAVRWGRRAADAWPEHTGVTAILVEAHLALGQDDEAGKLLSSAGESAVDFHLAVSRGQWLVSQRREDDAVDAFLQAAELAKTAGQRELVLWAQVRAAGVLLDSGRPAAAQPLLDAAARLDSRDRFLRMHRAELLEVEGKREKALELCEELLRERSDAEIQCIVFRLARQLGRHERAQAAFEAAESDYQRAIEAGELYTLEALARLYVEANTHPERALALAERNLRHKRDFPARRLVATLQDRRPGSFTAEP